jgi:hypothetical protein
MLARKHAISILMLLALGSSLLAADVIDIGSRRELFLDTYLVESVSGKATLHLHKPQPREVVLVTDAPWEGNTSAYYTIFQDNDRYRMYYRGSHFDEATRRVTHPEVTCYAESKDGIHWTKPELGLFEFEGSKQNNIVWDGIGTHCFTPFKDANPACVEDARYKAIARGRPRGKAGLYIFKSPDGIHWSLMHPEPVITKGAFDSQNLAFWDSFRGVYLDFHRIFVDGRRAIMTATSADFLHWSEPELLQYPAAPKQHLYTNAIQPYFRAPHILIGFPTRYLPQEGQRVEPILMSSRDGRTFHRWNEALIPEDAPEDRSGNRSNYMTWGLVQLPGDDKQLSVYATEAYYTGPDSRLRRFTFRVDAFVSLRAEEGSGELTTKPIVFQGSSLQMNLLTRETGRVRVELQNADGLPLEGFRLEDCKPLKGDYLEGMVTWSGNPRLGTLSGTPVRLRIHVQDADVFSFRFQ